MRKITQKPNDFYNDLVPTDKTMEIIHKSQDSDDVEKWKGFDFDGPLLSGKPLKK